ncbi:MAG: hypothetical protein IJC84_00495 [Clostridia bacterium]|nr:hypothetical protein [Clostridia bacterium]
MKRILTLFLVGILLLPSLFACGQTPQATATAPETAPPETPAIEIGESGSTAEGVMMRLETIAWSKEEAIFAPVFTPSLSGYFMSAYTVQKSVNGTWEDFIKFDVPENWDHTWNQDEDLQRIFVLTDMFDRFENGKYRFSTTCYFKKADSEERATATVWCDFTVTGMPPKTEAEKPKEIPFTAHYVSSNRQLLPAVKVIRSAAELKQLCETATDELDLYNDAYFQEHTLILVRVVEGSGSYRHVTDFVRQNADGTLSIGIHTISPGGGSADMEYWNILIAPEGEIKVNSKEDVTLYLNGSKQ